MKLLCDVCRSSAATVVCFADAAATCQQCDESVHAANKLAAKHQRAPLLPSAAAAAGCCDICQDRPPFFFCVQDRAILCRECDLSIHPPTSLSAAHRRFFLARISVGGSNPAAVDDHHHVHDDRRHCPPSAVDHHHGSNRPNDAENAMISEKNSNAAPTSVVPPNILEDAIAKHESSLNHTHPNIIHPLPSPTLTSSSTPTISIRRLSAGSISFVAPVLSSISTSAINNNPPRAPLLNPPHDRVAAAVAKHQTSSSSSSSIASGAAFITAASEDLDQWKKLAEELLMNDVEDRTDRCSPAVTMCDRELKAKGGDVAEVPEVRKQPASISDAEVWAYGEGQALRLTSKATGEQQNSCHYVSNGCGVEAWDFDCLFDDGAAVGAMDDDVSVVPDIISVHSAGSKKRRKF